MIEWLSKIYGYLKNALGNIFKKISEGNDWLQEHFDYQTILNQLWTFIVDSFYNLLNLIIETLAALLSFTASMLPSFEVPTYSGEMPGIFLTTFNWIFPTQYAIGLVTTFFAVVFLWFLVSWALRWVKLVV